MTAPTSPTFNLVNPIASMHEGGIGFGGEGNPERGRDATEFEFENRRVKPWEGERIHEVGVEEDLELTLGMGSSK